jgi:alkylation response protein AidB-like acyl-CoA dehydrogenase
MRLAPDTSLQAFRQDLEAWLDANLPNSAQAEHRQSSAHMPDWAREWQRAMFDEGYLVPGWPPELGGRNATVQEQMVYFEVFAERQVPRGLNPQGLSICAASIIEFGTEMQRQRFAIPTLKGDVTWCVGMSEPNAGSDLASLATKAELREDHFVVNGQKVWTSGAHDADYCMCFVRTDPDAPKHKGISVLIIDMRSEGITCRPLPELTDQHHIDFNEVFFTDVEVPAENLVGELNNGWSVSQGSLRHERGMLWIMNVARVGRAVEGLVRLSARDDGDQGVLGDDRIFADQVADLAIDVAAMRCLGYMGYAKAARGEASSEHMLLKMFSSETERRSNLVAVEVQGSAAMDLAGPGPSLFDDWDREHFGQPVVEPGVYNGFDDGSWAVQYLRAFAGTIAGGTSEIQRNIIAERVLGLPRG